MTNKIKLESLSIRPDYGRIGHYICTVKFRTDTSVIEIKCDESLSETLVRTCARAIEEQTRKHLEQLSTDALESFQAQPTIEHQTD